MGSKEMINMKARSSAAPYVTPLVKIHGHNAIVLAITDQPCYSKHSLPPNDATSLSDNARTVQPVREPPVIRVRVQFKTSATI